MFLFSTPNASELCLNDRKSLQHTQKPRSTFQIVSKPSAERQRGPALNADASSILYGTPFSLGSGSIFVDTSNNSIIANNYEHFPCRNAIFDPLWNLQMVSPSIETLIFLKIWSVVAHTVPRVPIKSQHLAPTHCQTTVENHQKSTFFMQFLIHAMLL